MYQRHTYLTFQKVLKLAEWLPLPPPSPLLSKLLLPKPVLMLLHSTAYGAALWWSMLMSCINNENKAGSASFSAVAEVSPSK